MQYCGWIEGYRVAKYNTVGGLGAGEGLWRG